MLCAPRVHPFPALRSVNDRRMSHLTRCIVIHGAVSICCAVNSIMHTPHASGALIAHATLLLLNGEVEGSKP